MPILLYKYNDLINQVVIFCNPILPEDPSQPAPRIHEFSKPKIPGAYRMVQKRLIFMPKGIRKLKKSNFMILLHMYVNKELSEPDCRRLNVAYDRFINQIKNVTRPYFLLQLACHA